MSVLLDTTDRRPVHFMGIGGAGMSALAELLIGRGVSVSGCDTNAEGAADIAALGAHVVAGHDPSHIANARAVVYSSAIDADNAELMRARERGIPVIRRAEALATVVKGRLVGVAGTHGKTTTTVMTTEALSAGGMDPTGVVGGRVAAWHGNLRRGTSDVFVVEADEYDRSFLALDPTVAVVTNIEADHLDIYRDLDDVRSAFAKFIERARFVVLCADDPVANALPTRPTAEVFRYGLSAEHARLCATELRAEGRGQQFTVVFDGETIGDVQLQVPGVHNVRNALAAVASGLAWGCELASMARGLATFTGVERRFQYLGESAGVVVVDDYAHHPTEIRATIAAARTVYPGRRLVVAFQPHLFTRTRDFAGDFGAALAAADAVLLTEIYAAREEPIPGVSTDVVVDALRNAGGKTAWRGERGGLADALAAAVRPGDVVLTVGAGDITKTGPELLAKLRTT
ncbi:MAG TPA: UDP-N-acetylmuramate--L-alanine ligase [Gemmatimonadaceae bacterium]|nr:UDP-N-acetylmuramate--L-alanine ligase [Gemmatimonadaceae bacterium]